MKIAIFDYLVTATNPAGSCHLKMLESLCQDHDFTVFSVRFENPNPQRIEWVRIPAPRRPLALLFVAYHLLAPLCYWMYLLRRRRRFELVQGIESNLTFAGIVYAHFCHAVYLREHWANSGMRGLRGLLRYIDHKLHAIMEPVVYRRAKAVVVPSRGLARELAHEYPWLSGRIIVLANPVETKSWQKPAHFDVPDFRREQGLDGQSFVLVFAALGQFERKGLPIVLDALAMEPDPRLELLVVGGESGTTAAYRRRCQELGIAERVKFTGMQRDVRRFLWASDAFVLPSSYEVFPLVCLQAAAAGLPLIVSQLNGVEEFLRDGENGVLTERSIDGLRRAIASVRALPTEHRQLLGDRAQSDVQKYGIPHFAAAWREFYKAYTPASRRAIGQAASV